MEESCITSPVSITISRGSDFTPSIAQSQQTLILMGRKQGSDLCLNLGPEEKKIPQSEKIEDSELLIHLLDSY